MQIKEILYKDLTSVSKKTTIKQLIKVMVYNHMSAVPVIDENNEYVGCISELDVFEACTPSYMKIMKNTAFLPNINHLVDTIKNITDRQVKDYMPAEYPTVGSNDAVMYAIDLMNKTNRDVLPVVDNGRLQGMVSRLELLSVALDQLK